MPCSDDRGATSDYVARDYERRLDHLTRILCEVGRWANVTGRVGSMPKSFQDWWSKHQEVDRERQERERRERKQKVLRDAARKKLTPEERRALGIK